MQQRRLRLGDILDDYCPRERRVTNHVVVAMIEDAVKQTRCTTCDADHEYKQARVPARRRKDGSALVGEPGAGVRPRAAAAATADMDDEIQDDLAAGDELDERTAMAEDAAEDAAAETAIEASGVEAVEERTDPDAEDEPRPEGEEDGPVHRRLIRATLPRPEGQAPEWKDPDFTVRQPGSGRGGFDQNRNGHRPSGRPGGGGGGARRPMRGAQGNPQGQPPRFGAPRHGGGNAPRHGSGHSQGQGGNRPGPGGPGHGQSRGPRPPGGGGRKRGGR